MSQVGAKTYSNRARKQLMEKIRDLACMEHAEIFKIVRECMPDCTFTQNTNGMFFNMSSFTDEVMQRLEAFVNFCCDNKKNLDDYDKRLKESQFSVAALAPAPALDGLPLQEPRVLLSDHEQQGADDADGTGAAPALTPEQAWKKVVENGGEDAIAMAKALYNSDRAAKKKVYTKFHASKKRFSKRVAADKRGDSDLMSDLVAT